MPFNSSQNNKTEIYNHIVVSNALEGAWSDSKVTDHFNNETDIVIKSDDFSFSDYKNADIVIKSDEFSFSDYKTTNIATTVDEFSFSDYKTTDIATTVDEFSFSDYKTVATATIVDDFEFSNYKTVDIATTVDNFEFSNYKTVDTATTVDDNKDAKLLKYIKSDRLNSEKLFEFQNDVLIVNFKDINVAHSNNCNIFYNGQQSFTYPIILLTHRDFENPNAFQWITMKHPESGQLVYFSNDYELYYFENNFFKRYWYRNKPAMWNYNLNT